MFLFEFLDGVASFYKTILFEFFWLFNYFRIYFNRIENIPAKVLIIALEKYQRCTFYILVINTYGGFFM